VGGVLSRGRIVEQHGTERNLELELAWRVVVKLQQHRAVVFKQLEQLELKHGRQLHVELVVQLQQLVIKLEPKPKQQLKPQLKLAIVAKQRQLHIKSIRRVELE